MATRGVVCDCYHWSWIQPTFFAWYSEIISPGKCFDKAGRCSLEVKFYFSSLLPACGTCTSVWDFSVSWIRFTERPYLHIVLFPDPIFRVPCGLVNRVWILSLGKPGAVDVTWSVIFYMLITLSFTSSISFGAKKLQAGCLWWHKSQFPLPEQSDQCDHRSGDGTNLPISCCI